MIGILTALGLSQRLAAKVAPWVIGATIVIASLLAFALWDYFDDRKAIERDRLEGNNTQLEKANKAGARAAGERIADDRTNREQEQAYVDAIENPRAGDSGDPDVRLACEQLRRDGQNTAAIPGCGGR